MFEQVDKHMPKPQAEKTSNPKDLKEPKQEPVLPSDAVDEASEESFPASDAPGWIGEKPRDSSQKKHE